MKKLVLSMALLVGAFTTTKAQSSLNFDGVDDYVTTNTLLLTANSNVTMECWVNWQGGSTPQRILYNGNSGSSGYGLYVIGGQLQLLLGGIWAYTITSMPLNTWTHVAVVQDGTKWDAYIDGVLFPYITSNGGNMPTTITTIGGQATGESFNGSIDEVRIWNVTRTQTEIQNNLHCSLTGAQTGLVANYNFDQGTANGNNAGIITLTDGSGNANDATLYNFALTGTTSNWINDATIHNGSASVTITASPSSVPATGGTVTYSTTVINGGTAPTYQWIKNGGNVGTNSATYTDATILPSDVISCSIISNSTCITNLNATSNTISVAAWGPAQALDFDGTNDYISIPYAEGQTEITHEFWFKTANPNGGLFSITDTDPLPSGWDRDIYLDNGNLNVYVWDGATTEVISTTGPNYADDNWHHVAHVMGTSIGGQKLYVDGVEKASGTFTSSAFNWNTKVLLGFANTAGANKYFQGSIDEVRLWNVARTQTEIQNSMNCSFSSAQAGLVANYNFNQGTANADNTGIISLIDNSGNANTGTLTNFTLIGTNSNWVDAPNLSTAISFITSDIPRSYIETGTNVTFTATSSGTGSTPNYQWMINGVNVGTNSNTYSTTTLTSTDTVACLITSSSPCVTTNVISNGINFAVLPSNAVPYNNTCYAFGNLEFCSPLNYDQGNFYYNSVTGVTGSAINDASILSTTQGDAYDGAFEVAVDDSAYTNVSGAYLDTLTHTMYSPNQLISGLKVSKNFRFYISKPIVRVCVKLENLDSSPKTVRVNLASDLGSDGNTTVDTTSTGNVALSDSTRWMITWDQNNYGDPVHTWIRYGKGTLEAKPNFFNKPENGDDYYDDSIRVTVPAHSTKYYVIFNRMDSMPSAARTNIGYFEDLQLMLNDSMFMGIDTLANVVNWNFMKPVASFNTGAPIGCDTFAVNFTNASSNTDMPSYTWSFGDTTATSAIVNPTHQYLAGSYTVGLTVTNANGLDSTITNPFAISPIDLTASATNDIASSNEANATSYQWLDCGNAYAIIPGATSQSYTATANGTYAVELVKNGCTDTSACVAIMGVGIKDNKNANSQVRVYPNPAKDVLNIELSVLNGEQATITIENMLGQVVYSTQTSTTVNVINTNTFTNGVYFVRVKTSTKASVQTVIIE